MQNRWVIILLYYIRVLWCASRSYEDIIGSIKTGPVSYIKYVK